MNNRKKIPSARFGRTPIGGLYDIDALARKYVRRSKKQARRVVDTVGLKSLRAEVMSVDAASNTIRVRRYTSLNDDGSPGTEDPFDYPVVGGVLPQVGDLVFGHSDNGKPVFFGKPGGGSGSGAVSTTYPVQGSGTSSDRIRLAGAEVCEVGVTTNTTAFADRTFTIVSFDKVVSNPEGWFDINTPKRVTVNRAGVYAITYGFAWSQNNVGTRLTRILKNGALLANAPMVDATVDQFGRGTASVITQCVNGDFFQAEGWQSSGGSLSMSSAVSFAVARIR